MSALSRIVDLRRGEAQLVFRVFMVLFGIIAGHTILETARDAVFLESLPASRLAIVYLALAGLGVIVPGYTSRFTRQFGRRDALFLTLAFSAIGTVLWSFQPLTGHEVYGFYLWSALLGTVLVLQFWLFAGRVFTVSQGKRLFGGIASGGVLGAVAGGVAATLVLEIMPREASGAYDVHDLLRAGAACFLLTAAALTRIDTDDQGSPFGAKASPVFEAGLSVLREEPYVRRMAALVGLSTVTLLFTDYLFKSVAKAEVHSGLALFFARYYAVLNAVAFLMQVVVAQRVVQRFGVVAALGVLPMLLVLGGGGALATGGLLVVVMLAKGADGGLRHSLNRVATELLYLPLPGDVRDRAKALLDAVFVRGSQAVGAGAILLLTALGLGTHRVFSGLIVVGALAWLGVTIGLRRGYLDLFRTELSRGRSDPRLLETAELDLDSVESIMAALSSVDGVRVIAAMNLLVESGRSRIIPALILYHDDEEVLIRALDVVSRADEQDWRPHAVRLLQSPSPPVRAASLRALGRAGEADLVRAALDDEDPWIMAQAAFQLARSEAGETVRDHPAILAVRERAQRATAEEQRRIRLGFLEALGQDADERWVDVLLWLAQEDDPEVVTRVARAVMRVPDERFVPILMPKLTVVETRAVVREALAAMGPPALEALIAGLDDEETPRELRRQLPGTIAGFRTQVACDALLRRIEHESDGLVRYRCLRGLVSLVKTRPVKVAPAAIEVEIVRNVTEHLRLLALLVPLDATPPPPAAQGSALLLKGLLRDKVRQALERAFMLFQVLHPREDVRGILIALEGSDRRRRASAVEFLEVLALSCTERVRELFRVAIDELSPEERIRRAEAHLSIVPASVEDAVRAMLDDPDTAIVALAAYHALALDIEPLHSEVEALTARTSLHPLVAEAAGWQEVPDG